MFSGIPALFRAFRVAVVFCKRRAKHLTNLWIFSQRFCRFRHARGLAQEKKRFLHVFGNQGEQGNNALVKVGKILLYTSRIFFAFWETALLVHFARAVVWLASCSCISAHTESHRYGDPCGRELRPLFLCSSPCEALCLVCIHICMRLCMSLRK